MPYQVPSCLVYQKHKYFLFPVYIVFALTDNLSERKPIAVH